MKIDTVGDVIGQYDEEDQAEEDEALSAAVHYAFSLTFDDEQLYYENNVAVGGNNDAGGNDRGMNFDDGGDDRGMNKDKGEQQVEEEMGEAWERVTMKHKSQMSDDELRTFFDSQLRGVGECPNPSCNCIAIIADRDVRDSVVRYLCWFNAKTKYEQDSIVFEWFKYSSYLKKRSKMQSSLRQFACMCFALGDCSLFLTGDHVDGDRSEGVDRDGCDADAQGKRKDKLQFTFEQ